MSSNKMTSNNVSSTKASSVDFVQRANIGVQALQPYVPGKPMSELARELGLEHIIKLASNENPLGCSDKVTKHISTLLEDISLYPDGNAFELKCALASHLTVDTNQLILGNGSNDILELIARAFLNENSEAVFSQYAFAVYPIVVQAVSASAKIAPAKNWGHDLDAMLQLITDKTKVVFIANPNNPTGTWLRKADIRNFLNKVPANVLVVLDEAYFEYVENEHYPDGISLLADYANLIVTRTFSKAYGLAGLRCGYGVADKNIIDILNRVRQPFNVNSFALACACEALSDQVFIQKSVDCNREGLLFLSAETEKLGLEYIPSVANFISINFGKKAAAINHYLLSKGLIVRPLVVYQMPEFLRITVGTQEQNEIFINLVKEALAG